MDFSLVASTLLKELEESDIGFAAIGGFGMGFWGVSRATVDMDFLLLKDDLDKADVILVRHGYEAFYKSDNVAQYQSNSTASGSIDLILAFREISKTMLDRSVKRQLANEVSIPVLIPEDIIGLKVQAIHNDPTRYRQDVADIESILRVRGDQSDWTLLSSYFELFQMSALLEDLRQKLDEA